MFNSGCLDFLVASAMLHRWSGFRSWEWGQSFSVVHLLSPWLVLVSANGEREVQT